MSLLMFAGKDGALSLTLQDVLLALDSAGFLEEIWLQLSGRIMDSVLIPLANDPFQDISCNKSKLSTIISFGRIPGVKKMETQEKVQENRMLNYGFLIFTIDRPRGIDG